MIAFRFLMIAARRYSAEPDNRPAAVRMMLRNILRLALDEIGEREVAAISLETLNEDTRAA